MYRSRHPLLRNHYFNRNTNIWYTEDGLAVTTLYLPSLGKKVRHHHLFNHFSAFGAIKNVKIYNKPTHSFGYTTFTDAKSAANALANQFHRIAGQRTRLEIADSRHQDKPLKIEHSGLAIHILDLNDECIFEIFSMMLIDISDLCAVARTCTRLKDIANRIFTRNYEVCELRTIVDNFLDARRLLVTFGSMITELWIGGSLRNQVFVKDLNSLKQWQFILYLATRCCSDRLKTLSLKYVVICDILMPKLKPLFNKLRKLKIFVCKIVNRGLFASCSSLVDFRVTGTDVNLNGIIENVFPELETFQYSVPPTIHDATNWEIFTSRHNFKRLAVTAIEAIDCFSLFAKNCKKLEELVYLAINASKTEEVINGISSLHHLKKLKIRSYANFTKLIPKLDGLKSLQCLEFQDITADSEFAKALSQLKTIQLLRLRRCRRLENLHLLGDMNQLTELLIYPTENVDIDLVCLIKSLNKLKTLHLNSILFEMNEKIYLRILDAILGRDMRSQQMLEITCYSPIDAIDTTEELRRLGVVRGEVREEMPFSPSDDIFNLQCARNNSHIVKLRRLHNYDPLVDVFHCKL